MLTGSPFNKLLQLRRCHLSTITSVLLSESGGSFSQLPVLPGGLKPHLFLKSTIRSVTSKLADDTVAKSDKSLCFAYRDDSDSCRFFSAFVNCCHPNFEPIEFKLAHVKRKLMLIN